MINQHLTFKLTDNQQVDLDLYPVSQKVTLSINTYPVNLGRSYAYRLRFGTRRKLIDVTEFERLQLYFDKVKKVIGVLYEVTE
jgi:hypothetical protein